VPAKQKAVPEPLPIDPTAVYTYEQAADRLQIPVRAVRRLVYEGRLGHAEVNHTTWRVRGHHLLDFLARAERGPIRR
jgi:excisionase family DNA binding protein